MEVTGGRRIEASLLKVSDLEQATKTGELKVFNAKQRDDDSFRFVPVTQADLREILSFIKHYRQRIIRATGLRNDHGFLFVSERTGENLDIDTLGAELYILRKAAGIVDEEVCLHAFRHRFITNIFRDLIRVHHLESVSDLRRMLLSTETLKLKVMEWTGHSSIDSLDRYIHLAFEAETAFHKTLDLVHAKRVIESLHLLLVDYGSQFRASKPTREMYDSLTGVVEAAASELGGLLESNLDASGIGDRKSEESAV
jgi:integrase